MDLLSPINNVELTQKKKKLEMHISLSYYINDKAENNIS